MVVLWLFDFPRTPPWPGQNPIARYARFRLFVFMLKGFGLLYVWLALILFYLLNPFDCLPCFLLALYVIDHWSIGFHNLQQFLSHHQSMLSHNMICAIIRLAVPYNQVYVKNNWVFTTIVFVFQSLFDFLYRNSDFYKLIVVSIDLRIDIEVEIFEYFLFGRVQMLNVRHDFSAQCLIQMLIWQLTIPVNLPRTDATGAWGIPSESLSWIMYHQVFPGWRWERLLF